jgi:hypothetical protein
MQYLGKFFHSIPTDLIFLSSNRIRLLKSQEIIKRLLETFNIDNLLIPHIMKITDISDSPKLRHWLSVSEDMLRSKYKVLDNNPGFVAHFFADSLHPDRISEIHALKTVELLIDESLLANKFFSIDIPNIQLPRVWNFRGYGTLEVFKKNDGLLVSIVNDILSLNSNNISFQLDLNTHEASIIGNAIFHNERSLKIGASNLSIPFHTNGIATSYHSNSPIIRGDEAIDEWLIVFQKAVNILENIDSSVVSDCIRLSPYILPLHANSTAYGSSSPMEIMGLIFVPGVKDPFDIAECLLHEALHQKLARAEEGAMVFVDDNEEEIYYSPWRSDPRPLRMLMHGAYVFTAVALLWLDLSKTMEDSKENFENALFHAHYRSNQAYAAITVLRKYGTLSSFGVKLCAIIDDSLDLLLNSIEYPTEVIVESNERRNLHFQSYKQYKH